MDRTVVVSGGGTGMGRAIARSFALDGDRVMILGRRRDVLAQAAGEINAEAGPERVTFHSADLFPSRSNPFRVSSATSTWS